ncbi:MAG: PSD1 domain-containing protein [Verrucomicrobia bacterium]|nr:PSD1 domain-containing protein [Verrucomicrobiota bacterium]
MAPAVLRASRCVFRGMWLLMAVGGWAGRAAPAVDFGRDILPILSNHCLHCHGPDEKERKGGLRLDTAEGLRTPGKSGAVALVPGRSAESELYLRIRSPHEDEVMPPPKAKKALSAEQVAVIQRWIDEGAVWSRHWSLEVPRRPVVPDPVGGGTALAHPVDRFLRARLEREGIPPSPEADRRTLVRRLYLDLIGLPPEPTTVRAFVDDARPDAYERLVDALLASPHFGERWGRHWLDLARYADSAGYLNDTLRPYAYLYRDWVIDSVNRDQPFDQFTIEQLAGDLLPGATLEQKIATGFHRNSLKNDEAGADLELDRVKAGVDRVATTGAVWLGLTLGCAECHSHKYDPISLREFYQLYAFFNATAERDVPAPRPAELAEFNRRQAVWEKERDRLEAPIAQHATTLVETGVPAWERELSLPKTRWVVLAPEEVTHITEDEEHTLPVNEDHSITTGVKDPVRSRYVVKVPIAQPGVTGFRLEALADLGAKVGRSKGGDFALAEFSVMLKTPAGAQEKLPLATARADFAAKSGPVENVLDGDNTTSWTIAPQTEATHVLVVELQAPRDFPAGSTLYFELEHRLTGVLTRFRLSATSAALPLEASTLPDAVLAILDTPAGQRSPAQQLALARHVARFVDAKGRELHRPLAAHYGKQPDFPKTAAPVLVTHPRKTRVHHRGDYRQPGEEVEPGTPAALPPLQARGPRADRLDLARWLVDPANPLTARVTVNHVWQQLFGRGLVATPDNFGALGERPSHPELLDWLATEFIRLGWSRKQLIRLLVTSATYRQTSVGRPDLAERDPLNRLLARQSRHRLEAEIVRDVALASSGLLNRTIGGPSIHPPLPAFVMAFGRNRTWPETKGPDAFRRGMYIHLRRNVPYPMLTTFDASDASVACTRRERSNSPLQALTLLNDPVFFACSEKLGAELAGQPGDLEARLRLGFERCLGRAPRAAELQALHAHHADQLALADGDERLAYLATARLLLNLDEFITRE